MLNKIFRRSDRNQRFWNWFSAHSNEYKRLEDNQDALFEKLNVQLKKVDARLVFEFGPLVGTEREFIISCDGAKALIPTALSLVDDAPELPGWLILAFRRRHDIDEMSWDGFKVHVKDVLYSYSFNEHNLINLVIYIKGYMPERQTEFGSVAFLMLDHILGEYDVMTKIGTIDFQSLPDAVAHEMYPLKDLAKLVDTRTPNS